MLCYEIWALVETYCSGCYILCFYADFKTSVFVVIIRMGIHFWKARRAWSEASTNDMDGGKEVVAGMSLRDCVFWRTQRAEKV